MDGNDGLLVGGVDGLEGLAVHPLDELIVDEPGPTLSASKLGNDVKGREPYKPRGCSYLTVGVVISCTRAMIAVVSALDRRARGKTERTSKGECLLLLSLRAVLRRAFPLRL